MTSLLKAHWAWTPGSRKIERVSGQLIVSDNLIHSARLLSQILRGWGIVALASERL